MTRAEAWADLVEVRLGALALLLGATALLHWALYARGSIVGPVRAPLSFMQHLNELRQRLLRIAAVLAYWFMLLVTVRFEAFRLGGLSLASPVVDIFDNAAARVYAELAKQTVPPGVEVVVLRPTEAVAAQLQVAFVLAVILALPAIIFECWAFFSPGLRSAERRTLGRALPWAGLLFLAGAAFAIAFVVPMLMAALYAFADPLGATTYVSAGALVGSVVTYAFWFGVAFELPLVLVLLVRLGTVQPHAYLRYWRHVTIGIFAVAALITDPTLVSQLIVGALLLALYWGGVAASFAARPRAAAAPAQARRLGTKPS